MTRPDRNNPAGRTVQLVLCCAAAVLAVVLSLVSVLNYSRAVREKNALLSEVREVRAQKDKVVASNDVLQNEARHLKTKVKNANDDTKNIGKIPKRLEKIEELNGEISELTARLDALNEELEALRAQLPPDAVPGAD